MQSETHLRPSLILAIGRLIIATTTFITLSVTRKADLFPIIHPIKTVLLAAIIGSVLFAIISVLVKRPRTLLGAQFIFDFLLESFLIYLTGAVMSPIVFLYLISIVFVTTWLSFAAGITYASATTVTLATMCIFYRQAAEGLLMLPLLPKTVVSVMKEGWLLRLILNSGVAFTLAILSGQLMRVAKRLSLFYTPILENIGEGVLAFDHHNRIIFINDEALRLLQIEGEPASFTGRPLEELLSKPKHIPLKNLLIRRDSQVAEVEIDGDDRKRELEVHISTLKRGKRHLRGKVVLLVDLTLRKEMEETQRRAQHLLELEEMSIGLAHELRNPLASIRGCAQQLEKLEPHHSQCRNLTRIIMRESDRLDNIVSRFLHLARAEPIKPMHTDIRALLEETVSLLKTREEAEGVEIRLKGDKQICHCDAEKMRQVFLNIGINALEALSGRGSLTIEVKEADGVVVRSGLEDLEKGISVTFSDTGRGIRAKELSKIFMPFFTTKTDGVGMGLAIANKIVAEHGGRITVDSSFGKGSVFQVWLPRVAKTGWT